MSSTLTDRPDVRQTDREPAQGSVGLVMLLCGVLFGAGLTLAQMTNPQKVLAFLTLNADWDPSLIAVLGSALLTTTLGYALVERRPMPLFASAFAEPAKQPIDRPLVFGALLFGVGWGMTGYCPGPAIVSSFLLQPQALGFLGAVAAGMILLDSRSPSAASSGSNPVNPDPEPPYE